MYRFFHPVLRPLLDAIEPSVVVEVGSDKGLGTELLADWCQSHQAMLHCVDPLPKYDVEEWLARWPDTLRFHRDLSLNALVDIGPADFVCIDGDHNWYTIFHELEILGRSAGAAEQPFPVTVLHDVGWPYGRRDLYYDPDTIPDAFRHPHRKAGILPGKRALVARGFNDHLDNAIHEGTPRNGVLTAAEDFVAQYDGNLTLRVLPGLHGLGIIMEAVVADRISSTLSELQGQAGLSELLGAVEQDRIGRLVSLWKAQGDLHREGERVEELRRMAEEAASEAVDLRGKIGEFRSAAESAREEAEATKALQRSAEIRADRAEEWYRQAVVLHDQESQALRELLEDSGHQLENERSVRRQREQELIRLRGRRSVRFGLGVARLTRPAFRLRRGQLKRSKSQGGGNDQRSSPDESSLRGLSPKTLPKVKTEVGSLLPLDAAEGGGPFFTVMRSLLGHDVPQGFVEEWNVSESSSQPARLPVERPLVSIIMPTFNRADLIADAIGSVLEQTYGEWELLICDDASDDHTEAVVGSKSDSRISYERLPKGGAAMARNAGLAKARGELIAYLDSDNLWHPRFLETLVSALVANRGHYSAYSKYIDVVVTPKRLRLRSFESRSFDYDALAEKNFIDLNTLVHRRLLFDHLGGFDERLVRQQDWDLILRYSHLRDPLYVDRFLMMYRRSDKWNQITSVHKHDRSSPVLVRSAVETAYRNGLASAYRGEIPSMTVLSWDISRNHFSKAYNIAEAMTGYSRVQLLGFRFFDEPVFPPYADANPQFETLYLPGELFPDWSRHLGKAVANASGDVLYAVKPRLPSLGVALLANYHFGKPIVLETNDLESVVANPRSGDVASTVRLADVDPGDSELLNPYGPLWTRIMEGLVSEIPLRVTHNNGLDKHFGGGAFLLRNPKDEKHFDPANFNRDEVRERLGFGTAERLLLFGGMVRRHKGVFELTELVSAPDSPYRLLVVGARDTPDQTALRKLAGDRVRILEPVDRNEMAAINLASDAVVLWLDPSVPASHYQMPFKLTDALAMKVPIVANDIGDLGDLGRRGYLRLVPFGRVDELASALESLFADQASTSSMVEAGRRLYLRQFSYNAVRRNLEMILTEAAANQGTLAVAKEFAEFFSAFQEQVAGQASGLT